MRQMQAISSMEPMLPIDGDIVPLLELAGDLRTEAAKLMPQIGPSARIALARILRAMNSYYSNKIEGQHTYPANLEAALQNNFSPNSEVKRRQELALAHMAVEEQFEQETKGLSWQEHFDESWICSI